MPHPVTTGERTRDAVFDRLARSRRYQELVAAQGGDGALWGLASNPPLVVEIIDRSWCDQCDRMVDKRETANCRSQFCKVAKAA